MSGDNKTYGQAIGGNAFELLKKIVQLSQSTPGSAGVGAGLGFANTQVGQNPINNMLAGAKQVMNPYQDGIARGLKKLGEQQASEAVSAGVPPEHILQQANMNQLQQQTPQQMPQVLSSSPEGDGLMQGLKQPDSGKPQQNNNLISQLLSIIHTPGSFNQESGKVSTPTFFGMNSDVANERFMRAQLMKQELAGQKPMQAGDREKIGLETAGEVLKETIKMDHEGRLRPNDLFAKFEQASQSFVTIRDAYARMQSLQGDPSPAGDLGIIFGYMKLLDPPSTIREGEQATAQNASAVPDRIRNSYNKLLMGEKLTPNQRKDFFTRSTALFKSSEAQQKRTTDEFSRLAIKNRLNPEQLFRNTGLSDSQGSSTHSGNKYKRVSDAG